MGAYMFNESIKKKSNIYVIRILEWEKGEGGAANVLQVGDKFPDLTRDIN